MPDIPKNKTATAIFKNGENILMRLSPYYNEICQKSNFDH